MPVILAAGDVPVGYIDYIDSRGGFSVEDQRMGSHAKHSSVLGIGDRIVTAPWSCDYCGGLRAGGSLTCLGCGAPRRIAQTQSVAERRALGIVIDDILRNGLIRRALHAGRES